MVSSGKVLFMAAAIIGVGLKFLCGSSLAKKEKEKPLIGTCSECYNRWRDIGTPLSINPCANVKIGDCKDPQSEYCHESIRAAQPIDTCPYKITASYTFGNQRITVEINKTETPNEVHYDHFLEAKVVDENQNILVNRLGNFRMFMRTDTRTYMCSKQFVCCDKPDTVDVAAYPNSHTRSMYEWSSEPSGMKNASIQFFATIIQQIRGSRVRYWTNLKTNIIPYYSCRRDKSSKECRKIEKSQGRKMY